MEGEIKRIKEDKEGGREVGRASKEGREGEVRRGGAG
jgi:hypothetical protein